MVYGIPNRIADDPKFKDEPAGPVSEEPGALNVERGANGIGVDGVEAPIGERSPDAANPLDVDATAVRDAETTTRIGRERFESGGTGGQS